MMLICSGPDAASSRKDPQSPSRAEASIRRRERHSGGERDQRPGRRLQQLRSSPESVPAREHRSPGEMSADVAVTLLVLAGIVGLSDATRRLLTRSLARTGLCVYAVELVSTFQLCCCTHELKLLSEVGGIEPRVALSLTYLAAVVHGLTFSGATGNPTGTLEHAYRARITGGSAMRRIACQFAAAAAARAAVPVMWGLGLSRLHVRHKLLGYRCVSPVHAPLHQAAAVELACAFAVQTALTHTRSVDEKYRVHAVAGVIASVVYAGGSLTGAVFNPALAFSTQFPCSGHSFLEYCVVYWLGPLLGMMSSVLLFDKLGPRLSRKPTSVPRPVETKKRT
ncbi:aquaporin-11-like [Hippoglossus hippoglossus]|uniref:aquaporin-11-like n=1 Tax=Hippoglossus hippoglossus TaxID=8267 RepID=UPI00148C0F78|nr:aquaporin-11-like [Hippoglossus hippoglossus]